MPDEVKKIKLTENQALAIRFIEQTWWVEGQMPTMDLIADRIGIKVATVKTWFKKGSDFVYVLQGKNIKVPGEKESDVLTATQLMAVNMILNLSDSRSEREKLEVINVAPQTYAAWRRDPIFIEYMHQRAKAQFGDAKDIASQALLRNVKMGDQTAIKFFYELTGEYVQRTQTEVLNVTNVMNRVIEVIQKYVKDPVILAAIADEFTLLAGDTVQLPPPPKALAPVGVENPGGVNSFLDTGLSQELSL